MDGIHDMGGMDGFGKVEPEADEPVFPCAVGGPLLALNRAMGSAGVWTIDESRAAHREPLPPRRLSDQLLLQEMGARLETSLVERGLVERRRDRGRPCAASRQGRCSAQAHGRRRSQHAVARSLRAARRQAPARFKRRRPGAHQEHSSGDAYAAAALRPRPRRRDRSASAAVTSIPTPSAHRRRRRPAMAVHGGVRRPRIVGRRRRAHAQGLDRGVRAVSGAGVTTTPPRTRRAVRASARRRRPGVSRALGGGGFCARAGPATNAACSPGTNGRRRSARRSRRPKRPAIPIPARPITAIGSRRWSASSPRRASTDAAALMRTRDAWERACAAHAARQADRATPDDFSRKNASDRRELTFMPRGMRAMQDHARRNSMSTSDRMRPPRRARLFHQRLDEVRAAGSARERATPCPAHSEIYSATCLALRRHCASAGSDRSAGGTAG